jgi:hypothetical protein
MIVRFADPVAPPNGALMNETQIFDRHRRTAAAAAPWHRCERQLGRDDADSSTPH